MLSTTFLAAAAATRAIGKPTAKLTIKDSASSERNRGVIPTSINKEIKDIESDMTALTIKPVSKGRSLLSNLGISNNQFEERIRVLDFVFFH